MLLLSADSPLGLQTLISTDADASSSSNGGGNGNVATRTIAASPSAVRRLAANGGGEVADGRGRDGKAEEERGGGGCWVSYGWRRLPRRLPPAIQSPRILVRERTADGRLVISREEAAARRVGARKVVKDRRLVLELVDGERNCGDAAPPPLQRRRWSHPLVGQEAKTSTASAAAGDGEESSARAAPTTTSSPVAAAGAVPVPPVVPAEACFEGAIREASLRENEMRTSLLRMVH